MPDSPPDADKTNGKLCGGQIPFGGGLALYRNKTKVGALGVSGDTSCTDHEIAKRVRHFAGLDPEKGETADASAVRQHLAERPEDRRRGERLRLLTIAAAYAADFGFAGEIGIGGAGAGSCPAFDPWLCAYTHVNSAPSRKICDE